MTRLALPIFLILISSPFVILFSFVTLSGEPLGLVVAAPLLLIAAAVCFIGCWVGASVLREERWNARERAGCCGKCGWLLPASGDRCSYCSFPVFKKPHGPIAEDETQKRFPPVLIVIIALPVVFFAWKGMRIGHYDSDGTIIWAFSSLLFVVSLVSIPIGVWLTIETRREDKWNDRERRGLCGKCGYDLRSSTGFCPECGFPSSDTSIIAKSTMPARYATMCLAIFLGACCLVFAATTVNALLRPELAHALARLLVFTPLLLAGFAASVWWCVATWRQYQWDQREAQGLCGRCGFDVRAARGVCPGCGFPISDRRPPLV